jgi:histidinol dehydrogenase
MLTVYKWEQLSAQTQQALLQRPVNKNEQLQVQVQAIINTVRERGDQALYEFTREFDGVELSSLKVPEQSIQRANVNSAALHALEIAIHNLRIYHQETLPQSKKINTAAGVCIEQIYKPIHKIGLYVPGGNNTPLISSLLMQAIPAEVANCPIKILCTPPNSSGEIDKTLLVAARLCNINTIFTIGGAQAIAALAYGTESIPKVFKIFGPGNSYVTEAKNQVSLDSKGAAIDLPAGPSEVMIIADELACPEFVAADLLAQAEHGVDSQVLVLCSSEKLAQQIAQAVEQQIYSAKRKEIIVQALQYASILLCNSDEEQIDIVNQYAPEHLIINRQDARDLATKFHTAGTIFIGPWAAETLGDYVTGSNHVLPTNGHAHAYSGLGSKDFLKSLNLQYIDAEGLKTLGNTAITLARLEGLEAHAKAVQLRLQALDNL